MNVLAILGPRSRPQHLALFQKQFSDLIVLDTPDESTVSHALRAADLALIFGGDGTLHRHLNLLVDASKPVLLVPSGSGNDFATVHGIRSAADASRLFAAFLAGSAQTRDADLGLLTTADGQSRYFSCCANVGVDADATRRANTYPAWLKASAGYLLGGLAAILTYRPQRLTVTRGQEVMLDEDAWFVAVTNTPIYGGGLPIAPQASIWDGELDVTCLRQTSRWNVIRHYPKILNGTHVRLPEIKSFRATAIQIATASPSSVYSDGDYVGMTPCTVTLAPGALRVITRAGAGI
jgi:diacylglycerol kinase (ATP)